MRHREYKWLLLDKSNSRYYFRRTDNCISKNAIYGRINEIKEDIMVEVTTSATEQVAEYFKGKEVSPIRIFLNEGG